MGPAVSASANVEEFGSVVRIGDGIRRKAPLTNGLVVPLLCYLEKVGFAGAPRVLDASDPAFPLFEFLHGEVPALGWFGDPVLIAAAQLIRRYHDATRPLLSKIKGQADGDVICHNDLAPFNCVFRGGMPIALIDFEAAAIGRWLNDLAYATWMWLNLGDPRISAMTQASRIGVFAGAYGVKIGAMDLVQAIISEQAKLASYCEVRGNAQVAQWASDCRQWTVVNARELGTPSVVPETHQVGLPMRGR